jgi:hypothetical protein
MHPKASDQNVSMLFLEDVAKEAFHWVLLVFFC